jgi:hypothetical protein
MICNGYVITSESPVKDVRYDGPASRLAWPLIGSENAASAAVVKKTKVQFYRWIQHADTGRVVSPLWALPDLPTSREYARCCESLGMRVRAFQCWSREREPFCDEASSEPIRPIGWDLVTRSFDGSIILDDRDAPLAGALTERLNPRGLFKSGDALEEYLRLRANADWPKEDVSIYVAVLLADATGILLRAA